MKQIEFALDGQEFIELNRLLKLMSLVNSGGEANMFISDGQVLVNGEVELRKRNKIRAGFKVKFNGQTILVKE
jgi:ribosome-associated protein